MCIRDRPTAAAAHRICGKALQLLLPRRPCGKGLQLLLVQCVGFTGSIKMWMKRKTAARHRLHGLGLLCGNTLQSKWWFAAAIASPRKYEQVAAWLHRWLCGKDAELLLQIDCVCKRFANVWWKPGAAARHHLFGFGLLSGSALPQTG
eukprot:14899425-Alexandrium_andersonii.AAC.1